MKTQTIKLTDTEVKTVSKALQLLKDWDEVHLKMYLYSDEEKRALDEEIETCMIIFDFELAQYKQEEE